MLIRNQLEMLNKIFVNIFKVFINSSLNVVLSTCVCSIAFFKLPLGTGLINYWSVFLLGAATWIIYIFDRIIDNIKNGSNKSERHEFHLRYQYNLQALAIGLILICTVILFFMPKTLIFFGIKIGILVAFYFVLITKYNILANFKDVFMPIIYVLAIVGISIIEKPSINLSTYILAFLFFLVCSQNLLCFSFFEHLENPETENVAKLITKKNLGRIIKYIGVINLFVLIFMFSNAIEYNNKMAIVITLISLLNSLSIAFSEKLFVKLHYRWVLDSLFFLFVFIF
jgi:hypothetical protein